MPVGPLIGQFCFPHDEWCGQGDWVETATIALTEPEGPGEAPKLSIIQSFQDDALPEVLIKVVDTHNMNELFVTTKNLPSYSYKYSLSQTYLYKGNTKLGM